MLGDLKATITIDTSGLAGAQTKVANFGKDFTAKINTLSQRTRTFGYLATRAYPETTVCQCFCFYDLIPLHLSHDRSVCVAWQGKLSR